MSLKELISCLIDDEMKKATASHDHTQNCSFLADYGGGTSVIYKAYAKAGAFSFEAKWQIAMINYDGNGNVLSIQWPINPSTGRSSSDFEFIWDNRATYNYSS
jgi:hypothetical protein